MLPFLDLLPTPARDVAYVVAFLLGLVLLERGADWFVDASAALATHLRAPRTIVGLLTAGGEWEELVVVLAALFAGHGGIALGDIIGSTIANVLGSFPLGLFGCKGLVMDRSARLYAAGMVCVTLLVSGLLFAGPIGRPAGAVLVGLFVVYVVTILYAIRRGMRRPPMDDEEDKDDDDEAEERAAMGPRSPIAQLVYVVAGLAIVSLGAWLVVEPAVAFAHALGLAETVVGLTIVAIGTTLPDKSISLMGGLKQQGGLVVANAVGSNIFLLTLTLGLAAIVAPIVASARTLRFDVPAMLVCAILLAALVWRPRLHWRTGAVLLLLYAGYLVSQFVAR